MVARRGYRKRRTFRRKSRRGYRKRRYGRRRRSSGRMHCVRHCLVANWNVDDIGIGRYFSFSLDSLPSYAEFTALYDQYRINAVVLKIKFMQQTPSQTEQIAVPDIIQPICHWVVDYTDVGAPGSVDVLRQFGNYRQKAMRANSPIAIKLFPRFARANYRTAVTTGYSPARGWLETASPNVPHYGVKMFVDAGWMGGTGEHTVGRMIVEAKYYLSFKNVQ